MQHFLNFLKYTIYAILYLIITVIIAYIILAESVPDDSQCHAMDRPEIIHYILAFTVTGLIAFGYCMYSKNKKSKKNYDREINR